ncbi:hypothetical protein HYPSUDRAFT_167002 [Hypholoma sublateritium FD-334 SS-4]|uniref:Nephrocystin 3-like N-terminal domain-containing protein n=1 Tax=Hypholoma sublateritium (strain FD-334 SS-4) TaxID=945553 RepID=A0A0D2L187_HYPSF|nr:hypothetical protein HYPSUDRAFT_167002 [Hypholoma sublateritium FD-334 SS-4]
MWIYGPAGAGKSAIMQTLAGILEELGILGGSFFFFRGAAQRDEKTHLIATLAYQLSLSVPNFDHYIAATIDRDPSIFSRTLAVQMKALVTDPMFAAARDDPQSNQWCYVMLVDGLDECSPPESHKEIITLLSESSTSPFRFIVASRPEFVIRNTFSNQAVMDQLHSLPLDNTYDPDSDIHLFLTDKFQDIKNSHPAHLSIPESWPDISIINTLVQNSSGQFIYAATVIKFVESSKHNPMTRLDSILKTGLNAGQSDMPFAQLDALYHHILGTVADLNRVLSILHCVMYPHCSYSTLKFIHGYSVGEVQTILCDMHSLLDIPDDDEYYIVFHHKSLSDFLEDPFRAKHLYVSPVNAKASMAISLINHFEASINLGKVEIDFFPSTFHDVLTPHCLTSESVYVLSKFNPYKNLSASIFLWENVVVTMDDEYCIFDIFKHYHSFIQDESVQAFSTMTSKLHDTALQNLDTWLSEALYHGLWDSTSNAFVPFICISMSPATHSRIFASPYCNMKETPILASTCHYSILNDSIPGASEAYQADIQQVLSDPLQTSYQAMQTLKIYPEITLLGYYLHLRQIDYSEFDGYLIASKYGPSPYWVMFHDWIDSLSQLIATINTRPECGSALKQYQSQNAHLPFPKFPIGLPYMQRCKLEEHRVKCTKEFCLNRKFVAISLLKEALKRLAHAAMDCFKKTNTGIEQHDYNRNHFICFLCQSTEEFVNDGDFGMDLDFDFLLLPLI